jgi:NAD(P)-dependent dehydrogenase (short-subunit alcohol dehydrogenase family)
VLTRGTTALITGASSGIGAATAYRLAREGVDVLLVARSEAKLEALPAGITANHGVRATALSFDLSKPGCGEALRVWMEANGVVVDVLVNDAGFGAYGAFRTGSGNARRQHGRRRSADSCVPPRDAAAPTRRSPQHRLGGRVSTRSVHGRVRREQVVCPQLQ